MGFGVLGWGSPSGPAPPLTLTPALSRPAGEGEAPAALCSGGVPLALDAARFAFLWIPACAGMTVVRGNDDVLYSSTMGGSSVTVQSSLVRKLIEIQRLWQ